MANSVAEGSIVLTLDSTKLNQGMKKAASDAKSKGSEIAKSFKGSASEKIGETFGGGSLAGMGAKAGAIGIAVGAVAMLGKELYEAAIGMKAFDRELEQNEKAVSQYADKIATDIGRAKEALSEFDDVAGTAEGLKKLGETISTVEGKINQLTGSLEAAQKKEQDLDSKWNSFDNFGLYLSSKLEKSQQAAAAERKIIEGARDNAKKIADELKRESFLRDNPMFNPKAVGEVRRTIEGINDEIKDIEGRSAGDKLKDGLIKKFGKNVNLLAVDLALAQRNAASADKFIKELTESVAELQTGVKKSAESKQLDELRALGIDKAKVDRIDELIRKKEELEKPPKKYSPLKALERGTWDGINAINEAKFNREQEKNKANGEGNKILKEVVQALKVLNISVLGLNVDIPEF